MEEEKDVEFNFAVGSDMTGFIKLQELASIENVEEDNSLYLSWICAKEFTKDPEFIIL